MVATSASRTKPSFCARTVNGPALRAAVLIVVARDSIIETERRKAERLNIKLVLRKKVNYRNIEYRKLGEVRLYVVLLVMKLRTGTSLVYVV